MIFLSAQKEVIINGIVKNRKDSYLVKCGYDDGYTWKCRVAF